MDQASLKNSDVLVLTGLTQIPTANPDGMVGEFCSNLGKGLLKTDLGVCILGLFLIRALPLPSNPALWCLFEASLLSLISTPRFLLEMHCCPKEPFLKIVNLKMC